MNWKTADKRLYVDGEVVRELPHPINKAIEAYGTVVMLADAPANDVFPDNAFGFRLDAIPFNYS